jgi:hypothetical protein
MVARTVERTDENAGAAPAAASIGALPQLRPFGFCAQPEAELIHRSRPRSRFLMPKPPLLPLLLLLPVALVAALVIFVVDVIRRRSLR